jgi:uncharacterized protein
VFLSPMLKAPDGAYQLINRRNGKIVAGRISAAFDSASRRKGLLGRDSLGAGSALIIAPTNAIHTWFMRFDIDVAFVAKDGQIVKLRRRLKPWRLFATLRAFAAIELPAGSLADSDTVVGDVLEIGSLTGR